MFEFLILELCSLSLLLFVEEYSVFGNVILLFMIYWKVLVIL